MFWKRAPFARQQLEERPQKREMGHQAHWDKKGGKGRRNEREDRRGGGGGREKKTETKREEKRKVEHAKGD